MKAMVTGGAGFIGSNLVDRLLAEGWDVSAVDNLSNGSLSNLDEARSNSEKKLKFYNLDVRDPSIEFLIEKESPEVIFHLAAQADVRVSVKDPVFDGEVNVLGTIHVLEGARKVKSPPRIVFAASGGTLYGDPDESLLPLNESVPQVPLSPYGVSKKSAIDYLACYRELHGIEFVALALANVYGPRQDPHGEAGVVAIFAELMLKGESPKIFGTGEQTRDFVFVDDVVDAFYKSSTRGGGLVINIGTKIETSVNQLFELMAESVGKNIKPNYQPKRLGELFRNTLDNTRAQMQLGWSPFTSLADGLSRTIESIAR